MVQRVSIIVAVLNGAATIERCLSSVARQVYPHTELIVIDGGSTDGTIEILENHTQLITHWESAPDLGVYDAYNKALDIASGDWILFLGADDYIAEEHVLETIAPHLEAQAGKCPIVYGRVAYALRDGKVLEIRNNDWAYYQSIPYARWSFCTQGIFFQKGIFSRFGKFDLQFEVIADLDLLYDVLSQQDPHFAGDTVVAVFSSGGMSSDPGKIRQIIRERRLSLRKHGLSTDGESNWKAHAKYCVFVLLRRLVGRGLAARAVEQLMILDRQRFRMLRGRSRPVLPRSDNS